MAALPDPVSKLRLVGNHVLNKMGEIIDERLNAATKKALMQQMDVVNRTVMILGKKLESTHSIETEELQSFEEACRQIVDLTEHPKTGMSLPSFVSFDDKKKECIDQVRDVLRLVGLEDPVFIQNMVDALSNPAKKEYVPGHVRKLLPPDLRNLDKDVDHLSLQMKLLAIHIGPGGDDARDEIFESMKNATITEAGKAFAKEFIKDIKKARTQGVEAEKKCMAAWDVKLHQLEERIALYLTEKKIPQVLIDLVVRPTHSASEVKPIPEGKGPISDDTLHTL